LPQELVDEILFTPEAYR